MKIFVHALEGKPEDLTDFRGKTERDIRVRWLVADPEDAAIGTGPWNVDRNRTNDEMIVLVRSGRKEIKDIEEVHLPFIPDGKVLAERLLRPDHDPLRVDFAPTLTDPDSIDLLEKAQQEGRIKLVDTPDINLFYLGFYWGKAPFDDLNFRRAVVSAIDVQTHADLKPKGGGQGKGVAEGATRPVPPGMTGREMQLARGQDYNKGQAKDFLRQFNEATRGARITPITLVYNSANTYAAGLAGRVADDIEGNLGITVVRQGYSSWGKMVEQVKKHWIGDMFLYSWHQRKRHDNDPYDFLRALFHSKSPTNLTGYDEVDALLDAVDPDLKAIEQKVLDDAPMVFLSHWKRKSAYRSRFHPLDLGDGALPTNRLTDVVM